MKTKVLTRVEINTVVLIRAGPSDAGVTTSQKYEKKEVMTKYATAINDIIQSNTAIDSNDKEKIKCLLTEMTALGMKQVAKKSEPTITIKPDVVRILNNDTNWRPQAETEEKDDEDEDAQEKTDESKKDEEESEEEREKPTAQEEESSNASFKATSDEESSTDESDKDDEKEE